MSECSTLGCHDGAVQTYEKLGYCSHHLLSVLNTKALRVYRYEKVLDKLSTYGGEWPCQSADVSRMMTIAKEALE